MFKMFLHLLLVCFCTTNSAIFPVKLIQKLNMGLINKVDMVYLSPVGYGV